MAKQVQIRRGTAAQIASFTGAEAELTVDTENNTVYVHDGSTQGGIRLAKFSEVGSGDVSLTDLSVTVSAPVDGENSTLSYNNTTGAFTFQQPDLFDGAYSSLTGAPTLFDGAFSSLTGVPTTIAGYGITDAFDGTYSSLSGKPTTIAGYGITDAFDGAFSSLTGVPTTIAGYGITDAFDGNFDNLTNKPSTGDLLDVDVTGVTNDQVLAWNNTDSEWQPKTIQGTYFVNLSATVNNLTPNGGGRVDFDPAIVADTKFVVDSDADIFISQGADGASGHAGVKDTTEDTYHLRAPGNEMGTTMGGTLTFGKNDMSMEFWVEADSRPASGDTYLFSFGLAGSSGTQLTLNYGDDGNGKAKLGTLIKDTAGTQFKGGLVVLDNVEVGGNTLQHIVVNFSRGAAEAEGRIQWWIDGHLRHVETYTEPAAGTQPSFTPSDIGTGCQFAFGATPGSVTRWHGAFYDVKMYTRELTMDEIELHAKKGFGPTLTYDDTTADSRVFWMDLVNGSGNTWINATYPDARVSDVRFTGFDASAYFISNRPGASIATDDSYRIRADKPEVIQVSANNELNILSSLATEALIKITQVTS